MRIKKVPLTGSWPFSLTVSILLIFFLAVFPAIRLFFRGSQWISDSGPLVFYAGVVLFLLFARKATLTELGFSREYLKQHLLLATFIGVVIAISPQVFDTLITATGLNKSELFSDTVNLRARGMKPVSPWSLVGSVFIVPLIFQTFFTGFVTQSLLKRFNPVLAIYGAGILFTLVHFKLSLGLFLMGALSAYLFNLTGTLYASMGFHMACMFADVLVANVYPRLITLFGFFY